MRIIALHMGSVGLARLSRTPSTALSTAPSLISVVRLEEEL